MVQLPGSSYLSQINKRKVVFMPSIMKLLENYIAAFGMGEVYDKSLAV